MQLIEQAGCGIGGMLSAIHGFNTGMLRVSTFFQELLGHLLK